MYTVDQHYPTYRLGNIRRFFHEITISLSWDSDQTKQFNLALVQSPQEDQLLGTISVTSDGRAITRLEDFAASVGLLYGSTFHRGLVRTARALSAAIDSTVPLAAEHGFRPDPASQVRLSFAETRVSP